VIPTRDGIAFAGVGPQVAGSSVWNNGECLGRSSNLNVYEVLGVREIFHWKVFLEAVASLDHVLVEGCLLFNTSFGQLSLLKGNVGSVGGSSEEASEKKLLHIYYYNFKVQVGSLNSLLNNK
jgi:hypothetical protein